MTTRTVTSVGELVEFDGNPVGKYYCSQCGCEPYHTQAGIEEHMRYAHGITSAVLPESSEERKEIPITTGVLDYFPAAIAYIAKVSKFGNDKHNPGEPLHWARGKSMDHADCIVRHLIERGTMDKNGIRHSGALAWRAMALLQEELEREEGAGRPRGARDEQ